MYKQLNMFFLFLGAIKKKIIILIRKIDFILIYG